MDRKNGCRWRIGLLAAGLLACCVPLTALASERDGTGIENMSVRQASPRADETDKSGGLVFEWLYQVPKTKTVYTAGGGQMTWMPVLSGDQVVGGTLVLKDAVINNSGGMGINFPVPITIKVEGRNQITSTSTGIYLADPATAHPLDLAIAGSGSLEITSENNGIQTAGNIVVDTVRMDIVYGSSGTVCRGLLTTGGDIEIKDSRHVKVKSNPAGIGSGSSAICAGQARGQTVRIKNSHVIAITGQGSAIDAVAGKIELLSSDVRAIGNVGDGSRASGTLLYFDGCTMDGGTLYAQNDGGDLEIPSTPDAPLRASNSAVFYGTKNGGLPLEGDLVLHSDCSYDEDSDEITAVKRGYVFGNVIWNENIKLSANKNDTFYIGYMDKEATLTIPKGTTLDIPGSNNFTVGNTGEKPGSRLINNGTINIKAGAFLDNCPNSTVVNNGRIHVLSGGSVYNSYHTSSQKGGLFQNNGTMAIEGGGLFQNQNRLENSGTIDSPGSFYMVKRSDLGYDSSIENKGSVNGFLIEWYNGYYVYAANGKTVLRSGQKLTVGQGAMSGGSSNILKVLDGAELTVEEGAVIDARTKVTMDTVSDYIDLSDTIVVNGELWLPEDTPEEVLNQIADKIVGNGSIVTGNAKKCIVSVDMGGQSKTQFVEQGGTVNLAEKPVRDGYNFAGWYVKEGSGLKPFDLTTPVRQSMEIISKWVGVNKWITPLAVKGWVYGEKANGPKAEPRFGKAYYRYSKNADGKFTGTVPSEAGTWYVKAYVDGAEEYTSIESSAVSFLIKPKDYKEGGSIVISAVSDAETVKNLVIKDGAKELVKGKDYTVTTVESGNKVIVTVTFQGNYSGTVTREYSVAGENPEEPEKPEKPAETKVDVAGNTILLNNKIKAVFSGSKIKVTWGKVKEAAGYEIYAEQCGKTIKLVKRVKGNKNTSYSFSKISRKKISSKNVYKIKVRAYRMVKGKKQVICSSLALHIAGKDKKGYTNAKSIKVSASKLTVKRGTTKKIKARTVKQNTKKKLFPKKHVAVYRYYSTNKSIATVSASGKVKGRKKGTCTVYVVAANGVKKGVKITVK